jgi:hypothetical protein
MAKKNCGKTASGAPFTDETVDHLAEKAEAQSRETTSSAIRRAAPQCLKVA